MSRIRSRRTGSSTSTNRQGWLLPTEGARHARLSSSSKMTGSIGWRRKRRTSRRQASSSRNCRRKSSLNFGGCMLMASCVEAVYALRHLLCLAIASTSLVLPGLILSAASSLNDLVARLTNGTVNEPPMEPSVLRSLGYPDGEELTVAGQVAYRASAGPPSARVRPGESALRRPGHTLRSYLGHPCLALYVGERLRRDVFSTRESDS